MNSKKGKLATVLTVVISIVCVSLNSYAHSGRTDSSGGHKDNKNKSELGNYHYHCGGYPAHLHKNGVCPYTSKSSSSSSTKQVLVYGIYLNKKSTAYLLHIIKIDVINIDISMLSRLFNMVKVTLYIFSKCSNINILKLCDCTLNAYINSYIFIKHFSFKNFLIFVLSFPS